MMILKIITRFFFFLLCSRCSSVTKLSVCCRVYFFCEEGCFSLFFIEKTVRHEVLLYSYLIYKRLHQSVFMHDILKYVPKKKEKTHSVISIFSFFNHNIVQML